MERRIKELEETLKGINQKIINIECKIKAKRLKNQAKHLPIYRLYRLQWESRKRAEAQKADLENLLGKHIGCVYPNLSKFVILFVILFCITHM